MSTQITSAPADGNIQSNSPELDTAMGGWGEGEREGAPLQGGEQQSQAPAQQTTAPSQRLPANVVKDPATTQVSPNVQSTQAAPVQQDTGAAVKAAIEATAAAMSKNQGQSAAMERAQKTMTDAEFAQRYGITKYSAKHLEQLFDKDPNKAAAVLDEMQRNAYTAAVKMSNDLVQAALANERASYAPRMQAVEKFMAAQVEREASATFYAKFPDLQPESDLVKEVLDSTQAKIARGELKFTDQNQAFQFVADATKKLVSRMTPAGGSKSPGQQSPPARQMAAASTAARPGGQTAKPASGLDAVMASWDEQPE